MTTPAAYEPAQSETEARRWAALAKMDREAMAKTVDEYTGLVAQLRMTADLLDASVDTADAHPAAEFLRSDADRIMRKARYLLAVLTGKVKRGDRIERAFEPGLSTGVDVASQSLAPTQAEWDALQQRTHGVDDSEYGLPDHG
jgi:ribosome modulation factor